MKVITITQPWATLVAIGAKKIETRSWCTSYRGPLAIHAAKAFPKEMQSLCNQSVFRKALVDAGYLRFGMPVKDELPTGVIIATCILRECHSTWTMKDVSAKGLRELSEQERAFGDYTDNRWCFVLYSVHKLKTPIPAKGALGLWEYPVEDFL